MHVNAEEKFPIGPQEILAVGLGAAALLRIRNRRKREARAREEAERASRDAGQSTDEAKTTEQA